MFPRKTNIPQSEYLDYKKVPEDWFIPISRFGLSDWIKNYMEPEARTQTLKVTLEAMVKEKQKERRKK